MGEVYKRELEKKSPLGEIIQNCFKIGEAIPYKLTTYLLVKRIFELKASR